MNRITQRFQELRTRNQKGVIIYIGAGDPDLRATEALAVAFGEAGADVLELGVPFSDPLADGVVNQLAAQRGLQSGTTPAKVLETVARIRTRSEIPIVLYVYYNLVHRAGLDRFVKDAAAAGVDGLLVLDLPPEEATAYEQQMHQAGLCNIYLVAPTTPEPRIKFIAEHASGFVYYVSREGVTGMRTEVTDALAARIALIRKYTTLPVAVGFGIAEPAQARLVAAFADAVVVGSAVVDRIARLGTSPELVPAVSSFVRQLVQAVKESAGGNLPLPHGKCGAH